MTASLTGLTVPEVISVKTNRLLMVMTFMSALLFGTSLYGQQEVTPTWYDPWPAPNTVTAHSSNAQVAKHKHQPKIVSGLPEGHQGKVGSTRFGSRRILAQFDLGLFCTSPWNRSISGIPAFSSGNGVAFVSLLLDPRLWPLSSRWEGLAPPLEL